MFARLVAVALGVLVVAVAAPSTTTLLPTGWALAPAQRHAATGTMPQGIALSPDESTLAIVESGAGKPAVRLLDAASLQPRDVIALSGAFGSPAWLDGSHLLIAGANADALLLIDVRSRRVTSIPAARGAWPAAVALSQDHRRIALCDDGDGSIALGDLHGFHEVPIGAHPGDAVFSANGKLLYVSLRAGREVVVVDVASKRVRTRIAVGLHPSALAISANGKKLYVAESDDDAVGIIDTDRNVRIADVAVGRPHHFGASPNALALRASRLFVSLGGANSIALVRGNKLIGRMPAGWYPTGVAVDSHGTLFVSNGKGEGAPANPQFDPRRRATYRTGYVALITVGSVRALVPSASWQAAGFAGAPVWSSPPPDKTIVRVGGPIRHVIYVIKENRSYDQVLGDVREANGDPRLVWFGQTITPNQHALATRFGVFDNAYADAQVSADGHNWADAAMANDYVERYWPLNYGNRRSLYDFQDGVGANVPHSGYLWDAAARARITYRDYGEDTVSPKAGITLSVTDHPALIGHFDPFYVGWNLRYNDLARFTEWKREFDAFVSHRDLPQLEIMYLPNDHTAGSARGYLTPEAYVATNDLALGRLVDAVSHSPYWQSTAIFALEDDAQNGPDHVSDQRSTFYLASPYARGGVQHERYSTVSIVHTIELLLGLAPLSIYDTTAPPMYDAFATTPANARPFEAIEPHVDLHAVNSRAAYGSSVSERFDFTRPDAVDPGAMNAILAHVVHR